MANHSQSDRRLTSLMLSRYISTQHSIFLESLHFEQQRLSHHERRRRRNHVLKTFKVIRKSTIPCPQVWPSTKKYDGTEWFTSTGSESEWKLPLRGRVTDRHCLQPKLPNFLYWSDRLFGGGVADVGTTVPTSASMCSRYRNEPWAVIGTNTD